jgi:hypothetical protein
MPTNEPSLPELGSWTVDELLATFQESSGAGSDYDLDDQIRFIRGVATVVRKREAVDTAKADPRQLYVFLLSPEGGVKEDLPREPMLDSGHTTLAGKVWFVNPPVRSGRVCKLNVQDSQGMFHAVIERLQHGNVPAVVVDPRLSNTEIRYYPQGLDKPDCCEQVRLYGSNLDLQQVCELIESVYRQCLITPDAQPKGCRLWKNTARYRPQSNAEHGIQALLKAAFAGKFPTCRVYDEFAGTMGRADLHLEEQDPVDRSRVTFLAVLELKVLRSYSDGGTAYSAAKNDECVEKGVKQAGMYRKERGHRVAALCCFDMRDKDDGDRCFEGVSDLAATLQVALRRWYLYASSERCRNA